MVAMPSGGYAMPLNNIAIKRQISLKSCESLPFPNDGIIFYDPNLTDCESLLSGLKCDIKSQAIKSKDDFFNELSNLGSSFKKNIYILCHGSAGRLFFGNDVIDNNTLLENSSIFSTLCVENIILYSCEVGQDISFINTLKSISEASIFYSDKLVGHEDKGGSWNLSSSLSENNQILDAEAINNILPFSRSSLKAWNYVLPNLDSSLGAGVEGGVLKFLDDANTTDENIIVTGTITAAQANSLSALTTDSAYLQAQIDSNDPAVLAGINPNSTLGVDNILFITVGSGGITTATAANLNTINDATTQKITISSSQTCHDARIHLTTIWNNFN